MKYLQDYQEEAQTALFNKTGAFFAFSNLQFDEQKKDKVKYVSMGAGLICPENNIPELIEKLDSIHKEAIAQDLKDNGAKGIIKRELYNHECFYTGNTEDVGLDGYGFTDEQIQAVYNKEYPNANL